MFAYKVAVNGAGRFLAVTQVGLGGSAGHSMCLQVLGTYRLANATMTQGDCVAHDVHFFHGVR
jgi:hypothetical protein